MSELLYFIHDKINCSGCTACSHVCPTSCIEMLSDEEGFYYPYYNVEKCINCKKCERTCPILNSKNEGDININQFVVTARSKNNTIWHKSTSGGAFSEICKSYGDKDTIIVGVEMLNLKAVHSSVVGVENIEKFRKSKYVQSDLKDVFVEVEKYLNNGVKLIFSGAPCQIAGLKSYLKKGYDNLFLIDFICHGVGSPLVFTNYIKYINEKSGKTIKNYSFREKVKLNGKYNNYHSKYEYTNGDIEYVNRDLYNMFFFKQLSIRLSCGENCRYRNSKRLSDITIADYKGGSVKKKFSLFSDYKNYSSIIVNTQKGLDVYEDLNEKMVIHDSTLENLKKANPLFFHTTNENSNRNQFFKDFNDGKGFKFLKEKYLNVKQQESFYFRVKLKQLYYEIRILYNDFIAFFE